MHWINISLEWKTELNPCYFFVFVLCLKQQSVLSVFILFIYEVLSTYREQLHLTPDHSVLRINILDVTGMVMLGH